MENTNLAQLKPGEKGVIVGYSKNSVYKDKLLAMGLIKRTKFEVLSIAPLGDPIELHLRGFKLSVRKNEAAELLVEKLEEEGHGECGSCCSCR